MTARGVGLLACLLLGVTTQPVDAQSLVQNNLEARFNDTASVNIDQEMARLIQLQSAYAANARVLQVAQEMLDALLRT